MNRLQHNLDADELQELLEELPHGHAMDAMLGYAENAVEGFATDDGKAEIKGDTPTEYELLEQALGQLIDNERDSGHSLKPWIAEARLQMVRFVSEQAIEEMYSTLIGLLKRIDPNETAQPDMWRRARADYQDGMAGILAATNDAVRHD